MATVALNFPCLPHLLVISLPTTVSLVGGRKKIDFASHSKQLFSQYQRMMLLGGG